MKGRRLCILHSIKYEVPFLERMFNVNKTFLYKREILSTRTIAKVTACVLSGPFATHTKKATTTLRAIGVVALIS